MKEFHMKISTEIQSAAFFLGMEKAVEAVAKAGFDAYDFSMFDMAQYDWKQKCVVENGSPLRGKNYLAFARKLRHIAEDNGIICNQSHAPFPNHVPEIASYAKRAIECTAEAGGTICVIHPQNDLNAKENGEIYKELLPFSKSCGVKIATENMWNWNDAEDHAAPAACSDEKSFLDHLEYVNDPFFVACLDIGHGQMNGLNTSAVSCIHALGHHLQALHVHDNDCWHDDHQIPGSMCIDFPAVCTALKEVGYSGYFTLEADAYIASCHRDDPEKGLWEMAQAARKYAALCD